MATPRDELGKVYVLLLEDWKFYVGFTIRAFKIRYEEHCDGESAGGAKWTNKYKPIKVLYCQPGSKQNEDIMTLAMMKHCGWQNVRGGSWCHVEANLPPHSLLGFYDEAAEKLVIELMNNAMQPIKIDHEMNSVRSPTGVKVAEVKADSEKNNENKKMNVTDGEYFKLREITPADITEDTVCLLVTQRQLSELKYAIERMMAKRNSDAMSTRRKRMLNGTTQLPDRTFTLGYDPFLSIASSHSKLSGVNNKEINMADMFDYVHNCAAYYLSNPSLRQQRTQQVKA